MDGARTTLGRFSPGLLLVHLAAGGARATDFPRPSELEAVVPVWSRIGSEVPTPEGLIDDDRNLRVVDEGAVLPTVGGMAGNDEDGRMVALPDRPRLHDVACRSPRVAVTLGYQRTWTYGDVYDTAS